MSRRVIRIEYKSGKRGVLGGQCGEVGSAHAWTPARVNTLVSLWPDHSASEIAAALGRGATRNCVIGKARRLGLPAKKKAGVRRPWTEHRCATLRGMWFTPGVLVRDIAKTLGVCEDTIEHRAALMGLPSKSKVNRGHAMEFTR